MSSSQMSVLTTSKSTDYSNFEKSIKNVLALNKIDEDEIDDEDDIVKPSAYALIEALTVLNDICQYDFGEAFPYCSASLEGRGGNSFGLG